MNKKTSKIIVAIVVIFLDFALAEFLAGWNNPK
jgi:hypothetical protein